jgi:hypothetical protein
VLKDKDIGASAVVAMILVSAGYAQGRAKGESPR